MGLTGYLIGGIVRDLLLNRPTRDVDIAINANPKPFLKKLSSRVGGGHIICLDEEFFTFRFIMKDQQCFDLTPLKGDSIVQDLLKRDFTINAMAIDLKDLLAPDQGTGYAPFRLIDPLGGTIDLARRTVRAVSEEVFRDDPLRILRAYRLAGQLDYRIEDKTQGLIRRDRHLLRRPSSERIREELFLILSLDHAGFSFELFHQNGLLPILFAPDLPPSPGLPEGTPGLNQEIWPAAVKTLACAEETLLDLPIADTGCLHAVKTMLSQTAGHQKTYEPLLKLAAFLSAFPQPYNWLDAFLRSLRLSTPQRKYALTCIRGHQRPLELIKSCCCTPRYFYRFFRDFGEAGLGALILGIANQRVTKAPPDTIHALNDLFSRMAGFYCDWQKNKRPPILDGNFLLEYFHLSPGPVIGDIFNFLEEARVEGKILHKEEAIELVRQFLEIRQKDFRLPFL